MVLSETLNYVWVSKFHYTEGIFIIVCISHSGSFSIGRAVVILLKYQKDFAYLIKMEYNVITQNAILLKSERSKEMQTW